MRLTPTPNRYTRISEVPAPSMHDPRFVPGISDYCDRWCERCPHTSRCHWFAMGETGHAVMRDINESFQWTPAGRLWDASLRDHMRAEANWTQTQWEAAEARWRKEEEERAAIGRVLIHAAWAYNNAAQGWLNGANAIVVGKASPQDSGTMEQWVAECLTVAGRYAGWIPYTLDHAMDSWIYDPVGYEDKDCFSSGDAKAALVMMDRSLEAWTGLHGVFEDEADAIAPLREQLVRLREETERFFPKARAFVRPGLDEAPKA